MHRRSAGGERCTYPGTSQDFWVDDSGRGHFIFFTAGTGIDARNITVNGVTYNFKASKQADGNWIIEAAGASTTPPTTTTTTTPPTTTTTTTTTAPPTTATAPPDAVPPGGYRDTAGSTHEHDVEALRADGVLDGTECAPGRFCPDTPLLRSTMAVWMVRVHDGEEAAAAPAAPAAPTVTSSTDTTVTLTWSEPANTDPAINDYDIQYRRRGTTAWTNWPHTSTARTTTIMVYR